MADLKTGTTIGGALVWTQGNFPLYPTGDQLLYKTFKIYTEFNKPQATDNDFVSKALGGKYLKIVDFNEGIIVQNGITNQKGQFTPGNGDGSTDMSTNPSTSTHNVFIQSHWGIGFGSYQAQGIMAGIDTRTGDITTKGSIRSLGQITIRTSTPTSNDHATRKDYVDGLINTVTTNANSRVAKSGDTMTGLLTAPNFVSSNLATQPTQVPQLSQVVVKGTVLDYGTY